MITYLIRASLCMFLWSSVIDSYAQVQSEICDNGIDDDQDGLVDLLDEECICAEVMLRSMFPNPSFEDRNCCPDVVNEFHCLENWQVGSGPTTDYINYCNPDLNIEHFPPQPLPDGNAVVGFRDGVFRDDVLELNWKEYAGTCLIEPLKTGKKYMMVYNIGFVDQNVSPPFNFTIYGHPSCNSFPFGDNDIGCPINALEWIEIASSSVNGGNGNIWIQDTIRFEVNREINAVAMGSSCEPTIAITNSYYFIDRVILDEETEFNLQIKAFNDICSPDYTLYVEYRKDFEYQWYRDKIAVVGQTSPFLVTNGIEGTYCLRAENDQECFLSENYVFRKQLKKDFLEVVICEGENYQFGQQIIQDQGTYIDTIFQPGDCDSVVSVNLFVQKEAKGEHTVQIIEGQTFQADGFTFKREGTFSYVTTSVSGCDSTLVLHIEYLDFFFPNIFSPNGDGVNDFFHIGGDLNQVAFNELTVIYRWGNILFTGQTWDGIVRGKRVIPGVYLYKAVVKLLNGMKSNIYGSIMVAW